MKRVLFFGDSITDFFRNRNNDTEIGMGYALLVKAELSYKDPEKYEFINRGISGDRVVDLYARIKKDCINLKPDYLSILIGVNDIWHEVAEQNGFSTEEFKMVYDIIISDIKKALPDTKIMILEPFVLEGGATCNTEDKPDRLNRFKVGVRENAKAAKEVAEKYDLPFVTLQDKFDELCKKAPDTCWLYDGVHPTAAGHNLIKEEWIKAFNKL